MKFHKIVIFLVIILVCVLFGISYQTVVKTTARQYYSQERQIKITALREKLIHCIGAQRVSFTTSDGIQLAGLLIERPGAERILLICHGYGMSKEEMWRYAELFPTDTILLFDFRAHGQSEGNLVSIGYFEQEDIRAAVKFLRSQERLKLLPLIGMGLSMGGATLLGAAAHGVPFDALIIDSTFAHLQEQITQSFKLYTGLPNIFIPFVLKMFFMRAQCMPDQVVPAEFIAHINYPILLIHSEDDEVAPVKNVFKLYAAARKPTLWLAKKSKHSYILHDYPEEYRKYVHMFLASI